MKREGVRGAVILALILGVVFFPALWGNRTLLTSSWDAPSIVPSGAYDPNQMPTRIGRTPDPGASAWLFDPLLKIIGNDYWKQHQLPLWNPYSAYGTPLAAAMQPQPFYPLTALLSIHPTAWTYNFFIVGRLFVAGLLMFLFARLFLQFVPALFAAVTFMLTGYFILFLNMPHLSVEVLLPGVLLTFELLLRQNSGNAMLAAAGMVFVSVTGGMPESLFLNVTFGCLYYVFRLAATPEFHDRPFARLIRLAVAIGLGFALSAFLLLPFLEFLRHSHDTHQIGNLGGSFSGLAIDDDVRNTILYLLPLIFGPVGNSIFSGFSGWTGMNAYWGIIPCLFAVAAVICCFARSNIVYPKQERLLTAFFAVSLALMLLKRFGSPVINWIGSLPLANLVLFAKYQEPLMAFCVAMLAGTGISLLIERRARRAYFLAAAGVMLALTLALAGWSLPRVLHLREYQFVFYGNLLAGFLVIGAAILLLNLRLLWKVWRWRGWGFLALLTLELCFNFIVPSFYLFNNLPSTHRSPYHGAPYIDFIKAHDRDHGRVFARENILYPDWAGVFGLADVRSLDAMYYRPYIDFVRSFLLRPNDTKRIQGDLADRFTGGGAGIYGYEFKTETEKRFLALSSVKYLISVDKYNSSTVLDEIVDQHSGEKIWGFGAVTFQFGNGRHARGLFEHPPAHRIAYKTVIDPKRPIFEGVAAIMPGAQDKTFGVRFLLEIAAGDKIERLFVTFLNPREIPADRKGRPFHIDLSRYAGEEVKLLFSTNTGPNGSNAYAWAGWAWLHFVSAKPDQDTTAAKSPFHQVYDKEVNVYEFADILPRASLFRATEILPQDQVLARLKDPSFNPHDKVILSRETLSGDDLAKAQSLATLPAGPCAAGRITRYTSQDVQIETQADFAGVLMLNDANYPGWRVYVNGKSTSLLHADYLFRAVLLPAGNNTVEFIYKPMSFRLGLLITAAALVCLVVAGALALQRRRGRAPHRPLSDLEQA